MEHLPEFIINNMFLCIAFVVVLAMTVRAEVLHQSGKMTQLSPMQATRLMNNESPVVIDVSETVEFESGHIKNAINVPMKDLAEKLDELQKYNNRPVLVYCKSGNQSNRACRLLKRSNFENVKNISGGLQNWVESNLPIEK